jgi:hypothetical protein
MKNKFNQFIKILISYFRKTLKKHRQFAPKYPLYCERENWDIDYGYGHE